MATNRVPEVVPSPPEDSEKLMNAFKVLCFLFLDFVYVNTCIMHYALGVCCFEGLGTDEKAIIRVLGQKNASQRKKIKEMFQQIYKKSLIDFLDSELSGDFGRAVILWAYDPPERDARLANKALKSRRKNITELEVLVEMACTSSPHHLAAVRKAYCALFECSLEEDIISNVSLPVQKVLVRLVSSYRYDKEAVDSSIAKASIVGLGTDEDSLTKAIVTRAEVDMMKVRGEYFNANKPSLDNAVMETPQGTHLSPSLPT
ncbi:annexin D3-like [Olea europaea var. sylvestris]|uniref:annexin D3-like n=1 Tax=Olea europaea var. sylvestris TaxID=158386 RepID=UPI000C1D269D|nr:annexin D3-like [Olea europaea var. sylvestris]